MRNYYVKYTDNYHNTYNLCYVEEGESLPSGDWSRISRKEAISLCVAERDRERYDNQFSGFADSYILPYKECYSEDAIGDTDCHLRDALLEQNGWYISDTYFVEAPKGKR
jgi:hypothetical protein